MFLVMGDICEAPEVATGMTRIGECLIRTALVIRIEKMG